MGAKIKRILRVLLTLISRWTTTPARLMKNRLRHDRRLEIGPGSTRVPGFETVNVVWSRTTDYIADAGRSLPFSDNTFVCVYASHVLEHIAWYRTEEVIQEWVRVLKPGGRLELWVPDGFKICQALVDYELHGVERFREDGWYRYNPEQDACKWVSGRLYSYGDGTGTLGHPNWHRALFTPRYLMELMSKAGLREVRLLDRTEVRVEDHGWINLGMVGTKP